MGENLQEFVNSQGVALRVDRPKGILRGVKLLGLLSRNGRRYLPAALVEAVGLYEGAKVNVNHSKGNPLAARDYQDRLGSIRKARVRPGEGLFGDLHFNPRHALAEQLLWDAEHAPENVGFSHNVEARTVRQGQETLVEAILSVQSVDLVADPATTHGLYESSSATSATAPIAAPSVPSAISTRSTAEFLREVTLAQLSGGRPDLIREILEDSQRRIGVLSAEVDRLRALHETYERRALAARVLKEYGLPDPDTVDGALRGAVSELFLQSLLAAPDERSMRALAEERAVMVAAIRRLERGGAGAGRPTSREQSRAEPASRVFDGKSLARAIT